MEWMCDFKVQVTIFHAGMWGRCIPGKEISLQGYFKDTGHRGSDVGEEM